MSCLFMGLLLIFAALFFGLEPAARTALQYKDIKVLGFSLLSPEFRVFLGVGIAFCELVLLASATSMLTTLANIVKTLKEFLKLLPLFAFLMAAYKTFWPLIANEVIPASVAQTLGISQSNVYLAQTVNSSSFSQGVLVTLVALLFFAITNQAFYPKPQKPKKPSKWGTIMKE
ncbi:MAG: hypothetical protein PVF45_11075 [Anaerolineae bacterium]